ncbi:hypothetical protein ACFVWF_33160 [Rhodococcus qingshengii]|uniref:hypothetical protein n=1 Tax=Rhodococcus qingshengii TaxID=334542 RepID=UPI0036DB736E
MEVNLTPEVSAQRAAPSEAGEEKSMEGQRDLSQYFTGKALEQQMQNLANTVEAAKEGIFKQTAASNTVESIDKIDAESNEPFVRMTITTRSTIELLDPETETWNAESAETVRYANLTFERGDSGTLRVAKLVYDYPEASE